MEKSKYSTSIILEWAVQSKMKKQNQDRRMKKRQKPQEKERKKIRRSRQNGRIQKQGMCKVENMLFEMKEWNFDQWIDERRKPQAQYERFFER